MLIISVLGPVLSMFCFSLRSYAWGGEGGNTIPLTTIFVAVIDCLELLFLLSVKALAAFLLCFISPQGIQNNQGLCTRCTDIATTVLQTNSTMC